MEATSSSQKSFVKMTITHSILSLRIPEVRVNLFWSILDLKLHLEKRFGSNAEFMTLVLQDENGNEITKMSQDERVVGFYAPNENWIIHVIDTNPSSITKDLEDLSSVPKYVMADEDYDKLPGTMRKFIKDLKTNNPELFQKDKHSTLDAEYQKAEADQLKAGDRCQVLKTGRLGTIKYVGKIPDAGPGYWLGIELDEPQGKSAGFYKFVRYFDCPSSYGLFLRPAEVKTGGIPEKEEDEI